jgi:hypothetical protein
MNLLREYIKKLLFEVIDLQTEWLSPQVVRFLINNYAKKSTTLGTLSWEYGKLKGNVWGVYRSNHRKLIVNKAKTKNKFKQQVSTILHEIQHWNQHVACAEEFPERSVRQVTSIRGDRCRLELQRKGYWNAEHEIDARAFAEENLEDAMSRVGKFASGKIEMESDDDAWEDILDELTDLDTVTRLDIGKLLMTYDMNTPENMQKAIRDLKDLEVPVK